MYGKKVLFCSRVVSITWSRQASSTSNKLLEFLASMPKVNSTRIAESQRQRQQIAKKGEKYGPSTVYLQVLGSGARGAPNTLYLFSDQKRYLFNCGECTQRLAHEHKVKLSRLNHIFITSKTWNNIGGLPGLSLTLQDAGVPNITLHGPEGLDELYQATRRFVIMKDMNVSMAKCNNSEDFEDEVMTVKYVTLGPVEDILDKEKPAKRQKLGDTHVDKSLDEFVHDDTDYYRADERHSHSKKEKPKGKPKELDKADAMKKKTEKVLQELQKQTRCSIAYICTLKKRPGTLDLTKCVEKGVKPGPLLGQLKSGLDVVLPDGTLVLSKDVKTPDDPGPVFIVLEVPELSYLKEAEFAPHFNNGINPPENIPTLIVHYTPPHVFHHPTYRAFMSMFGPCTRHLVVNAQNACLGSEAAHRAQHKLHLLDADVFPLLRDASVPAEWAQHQPADAHGGAASASPVRAKGLEELKNKIALAQFQKIINANGASTGDGGDAAAPDGDPANKLDVIAGRTLTVFHLRPKKQLDRSAEPKLHIQEYYQETMDTDGFVASLEQFRRVADSLRYRRGGEQREYPKIVFLGTGSSIPSKSRNTSGIALHIDENSSMLLDCGEGTFAQLVRFYGPKRVNAFLRTVKAIYVSHLHADHHMGLIGLLQARRQAFEEVSSERAPYEPVCLLAPGQIVAWLAVYDQHFERISEDYTLVPNQTLVRDGKQQDSDKPEMTAAMLARIGVDDIGTCYVSHCPNAFGVTIHIDQRHKITYSGDTIPCEELVRLGQDSTLLIHEATMEDELAEEARVKMHSTTSQAMEVGRRMGAAHTLLTHFSQRYARLPRLNATMLHDNTNVGIAFDNMQITMSDLELLPHMYAPLQLMFAEHCVEMELRAAHRSRQRERRALSPFADSNGRGSSLFATSAGSGPRTHAPYRESNASRLRQEAKGMTVCGTLGRSKSRPRSKTSTSSIPRPRSASAHTSGSTTPSVNERALHATGPTDSRATIDVNERLSHASVPLGKDCRDGHERPRVASATNPGIANSRSRTAASIHRTSAIREKQDAAGQLKKSAVHCNYYTTTDNTSGYGMPLVTPVNRRLSIKREQPQDSASAKVSAAARRSRIPLMSFRAGNYDVSAPALSSRRTINNNVLLNVTKVDVVTSVVMNLIIWRVAQLTSYICEGRVPFPLLNIIIAAIALFWTAAKGTVSGNQLRGSNGNNVKADIEHLLFATATSAAKPITTYSPTPAHTTPTRSLERKATYEKRSASGGRSPSPSVNKDNRNAHSDIPTSPMRKQSKTVTLATSQVKIRSVLANNNRNASRTELKSSAHGKNSDPTERKSSTRVHQPSSESVKKSVFSSGKPLPVIAKPYSSSRSFKPQLEDIKSSLLLLNHKEDRNIKLAGPKSKLEKSIESTNKPKITNELQRREQLMKIKNRFKSKQFFSESKYDKIEGLNWISWK